jgi:cellulose synthase/poly-beta-1,6-N-acetylglucosamine synthase-like glycosyltransferase
MGQFEMNHLVICAIFKNESRYIYEWLSYHHSIGVDAFYLYNNNSTDDTVEIIRSWPYSHLVIVQDWPGAGVQ